MKYAALLISLLVVAMLVIPASAAGAEPVVTNETITHEATVKPTTVPTTVATTHPVTAVPTTEAPGSQVGWLTIISSPSGAAVFIDGKVAGITPISGRELGAGTHTIEITMTGYERYTATKDLRAGEQSAIDATLKPVPVTAVPTAIPTTHVTMVPTAIPTTHVTTVPTVVPTTHVTMVPTAIPTTHVTMVPTVVPTTHVTMVPTAIPTTHVTMVPTAIPTTHVTTAPVGSDRGWIRVNCNVNGAVVTFDASSTGCSIAQGFCDTGVVTTGTPYRTFTVRKSGYRTFTGPVTSWPANGKTVNLYATLKPIPTPSYGNIRVISKPAGAIATIDGGTWQRTPATFSSVRAGTSHNVHITMSGYQSYGTSTYVTAGQTVTVNAYLTPNPQQTGSLNINTVPEGGDIYLDGRFMAETPHLITNLVPGSHTLRLHKAGYDEYLQTVTVNAGQQTPVTVTFTPQHPSMGSIEVGSTPGGSSVYLDGKYMGQTPAGGSLDLTSVREGSHTILIRHTDYQDYTQTVYVKGGTVVTVNTQLTPNAPSPVPDTTGQIVVSSTPSGAEVLLDNTFKGITPVTLSDIPAGTHVVTVKQTGYTDASQTVTVTGGQSTTVILGLVAVPPTTKSPVTGIPAVAAFAIAGVILAIGRRRE
ncbi:PEGA domain-containing protein [Methanogenium sp. MK-MG]|uniref:PEGA domain-containing protein n=1 Tax=Methanogenium sp. MK-MG TaxID=2599926 RepID=UPI0013ED4868|nr:PEGA domain-containing protein [Methanogenium sp. MK-MG]